MPSRSRSQASSYRRVPRTNRLEQHQTRLDARHDAHEPTLTLNERQPAQVFTINRENIKREEVRPLTTEQEIVEPAPTISAQADDLAIEHRAVRANGMRDFFCEVRPTLERMAVARHELAVMAGDVRQRAEPSNFTSYKKSGSSNGSGMRNRRIGRSAAGFERRTLSA
jgi:hypothetical protein